MSVENDAGGRLNTAATQDQVRDLLFPPDTAETQDPAAEETQPEPQPGQIDRQDEADHREGEPEASEDQPAETPANDLAALAEKAGITVKELYKVQIPMADGEQPITLGQYKDRVRDLQRVDALRAEVEDSQNQSQADRLQFQRELQTVAQAMQQGRLDEQTLKQARDGLQRYEQQQTELLRQAVPEMAKPETVDAVAVEWERYGVPRAVFDQIHDAGIKAGMYRLHQLEQRLRDAKAREVKPKQAPSRPGPKQSRAEKRSQVIEQHRQGRLSETEAAAKLIFGG